MANLSEFAPTSLRYPASVDGLLKEVSFGPNEVIHRAGERYRDMYVIAEGSLEVRQKSGATDALLGPGSVIGEPCPRRGDFINHALSGSAFVS